MRKHEVYIFSQLELMDLSCFSTAGIFVLKGVVEKSMVILEIARKFCSFILFLDGEWSEEGNEGYPLKNQSEFPILNKPKSLFDYNYLCFHSDHIIFEFMWA